MRGKSSLEEVLWKNPFKEGTFVVILRDAENRVALKNGKEPRFSSLQTKKTFYVERTV